MTFYTGATILTELMMIAMMLHVLYYNGFTREQKTGIYLLFSARIIAIADVFDALISERCYKKPFPFEEAVKIIESGAGNHFDPKLVGVFLNHKNEFQSL